MLSPSSSSSFKLPISPLMPVGDGSLDHMSCAPGACLLPCFVLDHHSPFNKDGPLTRTQSGKFLASMACPMGA